ncbi:hypothetical protein FH972_022332 [Carpinus fangiana]|uniref:Alpha-1,3/1,6-mannosyltransferase ALG2 n=1 Tax=Carpinus fangiana TaxID=176857 RepID=A0A5N6KRZ3_9ROSI|nr:hypothetical protein FH972_022332 [Carpinus fangiana]
MAGRRRNIVFFHPDLGIGGAERLVVDAAVALQDLGHTVTIFTSHCDPAHCFDEARDGTLDVRVRGNTLIPPSILNRFFILCAILRQVHLVLQICFITSELQQLKPDAFFADQLSACIPLLRFFLPQTRLLFYCHFPDKLLAYRESAIKKFYRIPFDWFEGWTTGLSDVIAVNSKFTRQIFGEAFPTLESREPRVIYPCVDVQAAQKDSGIEGGPEPLWKGRKVILSINRFERKKDIGLAVKAFAGLPPAIRSRARLVIAGGYDPRMAENVSHHKELEQLADSLKLRHATATNIATAMAVPDTTDVLFLLSVPSSLKLTLLRSASLLVYTPKYEHFGIVPLEAMLEKVPVLAAATGGPTETVVDGQTGWSRSVEAVEEWTEVMRLVLSELSERDLHCMGDAGRQRVVEHFSQVTMGQRLDDEISAMVRIKKRPEVFGSHFIVAVVGFVGFNAVLAAIVLPAK